MSGPLALPAPVNGNGISNGNANGHAEPSPAPAPGPTQPKFAVSATGIILPPPEVKSIIDRTASFVARSANPPQFEDKIRENQRHDPKFSFLNPADPYHAYYRSRVEKVAKGETDEDAAMKDSEKVAKDGQEAGPEGGEVKKEVEKDEDVGVEPPSPEFILDLPSISAIDLDIMKLTALFAARRGRSFLQALSVKEARNYQFDFLKPNHSLFPSFNQLIEQYTKILLPSTSKLDELKRRAQDPNAKWETLEEARKHAKWEHKKRDQEQRREDHRETERLAFAEIDWHDYAIVQTIEFTASDAASELPPPMSVQEVENMTLAQKRMAAMIMETTAEDVEAHRARQAEAQTITPVGVNGDMEADGDDGDVMIESDAEEETGEDAEIAERKRKEEEERNREMERAKAIQASSLGAGGQMKIRTDYVPKIGAKNKVALTTCSICGQQIPVDELDEHMRIELLDPRWKSQRDALEARKAQASELQRGANVVSSLRNLARTRVDIFGGEDDEERRKREEEEENARRKEREKVVWDGHTASKVTTMDKYSQNSNIDEQIAAIHRSKLGLGVQDGPGIGPGIGPAAVPPPMTPNAAATAAPIPGPVPVPGAIPPSLPSKPMASDGSIPQPTSTPGVPPPTNTGTPVPPAPNPMQMLPPNPNPAAYSAATVASGPQPASMYPPSQQPTPVMLPPLHYQGLNASQPFGYQPPPGLVPGGMPVLGMPPGYVPSPGGAVPGTPLSAGGTPVGAGAGIQPATIVGGVPQTPMSMPQTPLGATQGVAGVVRSADDMMEGVEDGGPPGKKQRVAKLPSGQFYPEQDWINMHPNPVTLQIQLPSDKPEVGLDGKLVTIPDLPLDLLVSTLRDRIMKSTNITMGYSAIRLAYDGKMMTNSQTLASYNLEDEDLVVLTVREPKKKK